MFFLPDSSIDKLDDIFKRVEKGTGDADNLCHEALQLHPYDHFALFELTKRGREADHRDEVERLTWRIAELFPWTFMPYMRLAELYSADDALSKGLGELAFRKLLLIDTEVDLSEFAVSWHVPNEDGLKYRAGLERTAERLAKETRDEPAEVTARLRPYRLFDQLFEMHPVKSGLVDEIVAEGRPMVPLLMGVVRGWVTDMLPKDTEFVSSVLGLIGEIGDTSVVPELLELPTVEDPFVSEPAVWAINRIIEQHPKEATDRIRSIVSTAPAGVRIAIAQTLLQHPEIDPGGTIYDQLFDNFESIDKELRDPCFETAMATGLFLRGRAGVEEGRSRFRTLGHLLSREARRKIDDILADFGSMPLGSAPPPLPKPVSHTVCELCADDVNWEKELAEQDPDDADDEEAYIPEPIVREVLPGRNDPCWCGSGKKYKKCHLDSDEERARQSP
jgi:hypothetical protein